MHKAGLVPLGRMLHPPRELAPPASSSKCGHDSASMLCLTCICLCIWAHGYSEACEQARCSACLLDPSSPSSKSKPACVAQLTCIYLFHELPPEARRQAAKEMARVMKPGGVVVITDSVQLGDRPDTDADRGLIGGFNEPFYESFIISDLGVCPPPRFAVLMALNTCHAWVLFVLSESRPAGLGSCNGMLHIRMRPRPW